MTDKELRRLDKGDLIEIIYRLRLNEDSLKEELETTKAELAEVKEKLADRELKIQNSGSIAEAVVKLNGLFEAAQRTADDYVAQVKRMSGSGTTYGAATQQSADVDAECARKLAETEEKCRRREEECDRLIDKKWALFKEEAKKYVEKIKNGKADTQ